MSKSGVSVKGTMDFPSMVAFLEDLVGCFKEKTICIQRGDEFITLKPAENIEMEIEAKQKKGKEKLVLELSWREELPQLDEEEAEAPFRVSAKEPELPPCDVPQGMPAAAACEPAVEVKAEVKADAKPEVKAEVKDEKAEAKAKAGAKK